MWRGGHQEAVDEAGFEHRLADSGDDNGLVDIGAEHVEVVFFTRRLAHYVIAAGQYARDDGGLLSGFFFYGDFVAYGNRVGEFEVVKA